MDPQRGIFQNFREFRRNIRRADLLTHPRLVFAFIVKELRHRDNFDRFQRFPVQNADVKFASAEKGFAHQVVGNLRGFLERLTDFFFIIALIGGDGGPAAGRLDKLRIAQGADTVPVNVFRVNHVFPGDSWNAAGFHQVFGYIFVHGFHTAVKAGAGVVDVELVKCGLDLAVFAAFAMKSDKHHIRKTADFQNILSEVAAGVRSALSAHFFKIRRFGRNFYGLRFIVRQLFE